MYRLHLTRNLRTLALLLTVAVGLAALGALGWANFTGMPEPWRAAIEREVAKQGAHIQIGGLRYLPLRGVVATQVRVFADAGRLHEISRLERITFDFDKSQLARGVVHLNKIRLDGARLLLPIDPQDPATATLKVTDINGTVLMPGDRRLVVRDAHGKIAGIDVTLNANVIGYQQDGSPAADDSSDSTRRERLQQVMRALDGWHFDPEHPPILQIAVEGDVNDRSTLNAKLGLQVKGMEKNGHVLDSLTLQADLASDLLTVTTLHATDSVGSFEGHADYNLREREGRFDVCSSLEAPQLLAAWLKLPMPHDVRIDGKQLLEAEGSYQLKENQLPQIGLTGHLRCDGVLLKGKSFDTVETGFAWRDGRFFLRDLQLIRADGQATAKVLIEWPVVKLELHSTLPVPVYRPFFIGQPLEMVINDFTEREGAAVEVTLAGNFDLTNHESWSYTGKGDAKNVNYRGVPVNAAHCKLKLNHHELDFFDGTAVFNYSQYPLCLDFNGAPQGTAKVGRIRYDAASKIVQVENVRGSIWAAPMVRLFAPHIADSLEKYRFHQPPEMKAAGVVDVTNAGRTALNITFSSDQPADYRFLGENLTLGHPRGQVDIRGDRVTVSNLALDGLGGPITARFDHIAPDRLEGEMSWTQLSIAELTQTYGFNMKGGGSLTGRIRFSMTDDQVETMSGEGLLAFENAELFSVPMFGPLTPLIAGVLNDEKAGSQPAKNAFGTFKIENGILTCNDFQTTTTSLNFTGEGSLDLSAKTVDMTMRLNARGLLGLLTLPLRPISGMFQFRGAGPLKNPKWENIQFSPPTPSHSPTPVDPPKATAIPSGP